MNVLKVKILNADKKFLHGNKIVNGQLAVLVDSFATHRYKKYGAFYYSEVDGFVSIYEHKPRETDGFGGRLIKLQMEDGETLEFKGTLWDPFSIPENLQSMPVVVTDDIEAFERGYTFYSYKCTPAKYKELIAKC